MRRVLPLVLSACAMFAVAVPAEATPVTVNPGDTLIFNWDLPSQGADPLPPYWSVDVSLDVTEFDFGDTWALDVFNGLDLSGGLAFSASNTASGFIAGYAFYPGLMDGVFSLRLTMNTGSIVINDPTARAFNNYYGVQRWTAYLAPLESDPDTETPAPEPATLTLLGLCLAGAGARRWRQRKA